MNIFTVLNFQNFPVAAFGELWMAKAFARKGGYSKILDFSINEPGHNQAFVFLSSPDEKWEEIRWDGNLDLIYKE